jgi:hypothetical protein
MNMINVNNVYKKFGFMVTIIGLITTSTTSQLHALDIVSRVKALTRSIVIGEKTRVELDPTIKLPAPKKYDPDKLSEQTKSGIIILKDSPLPIQRLILDYCAQQRTHTREQVIVPRVDSGSELFDSFFNATPEDTETRSEPTVFEVPNIRVLLAMPEDQRQLLNGLPMTIIKTTSKRKLDDEGNLIQDFHTQHIDSATPDAFSDSEIDGLIELLQKLSASSPLSHPSPSSSSSSPAPRLSSQPEPLESTDESKEPKEVFGESKRTGK